MDNVYAGLEHIDDVAPFDPARDQPLFDEIRAVLERHDALDRFGLTLLHTHFAVGPQERLREVCDPEARTLLVRPEPIEAPAGETAIATNWRFLPARMGVTQACYADCLVSNGKHKEIHKKQWP